MDDLNYHPKVVQLRAHSAEETEAYMKTLGEADDTAIALELWTLSMAVGDRSVPFLPELGVLQEKLKKSIEEKLQDPILLHGEGGSMKNYCFPIEIHGVMFVSGESEHDARQRIEGSKVTILGNILQHSSIEIIDGKSYDLVNAINKLEKEKLK